MKRFLLPLLLAACLLFPALVLAQSTTTPTVADVAARKDYTGDGGTTSFYYNFPILANTDIEVMLNGVDKVLSTDYTVAGMGASGGGSVTFTTAPTAGVAVTLLRKQPVSQLSVYVPNEAFPSTRIQTDLDKLDMQIQMLRERLVRGLKLQKQSLYTDLSVPDPVAGDMLAWNASLTGLQNVNPVTFSATTSTLPTPCTIGAGASQCPAPASVPAGTLVRVTDNIRGLWKNTGSAWVSVTGKADFSDFGGSTTATGAANLLALQANSAAALAACAHINIPPGPAGAYYPVSGSMTTTLATRYCDFGVDGGGYLLFSGAGGDGWTVDGSSVPGGNGGVVSSWDVVVGGDSGTRDALVWKAINYSGAMMPRITGSGRAGFHCEDCTVPALIGGLSVAGVWGTGGAPMQVACWFSTAASQGSNGMALIAPTCAAAGTPLNVTVATGGTPITITVSAGSSNYDGSTGYQTGDVVSLANVCANVNAPLGFQVTRVSATQFTLQGSSGACSYGGSGGTVTRGVGALFDVASYSDELLGGSSLSSPVGIFTTGTGGAHHFIGFDVTGSQTPYIDNQSSGSVFSGTSSGAGGSFVIDSNLKVRNGASSITQIGSLSGPILGLGTLGGIPTIIGGATGGTGTGDIWLAPTAGVVRYVSGANGVGQGGTESWDLSRYGQQINLGVDFGDLTGASASQANGTSVYCTNCTEADPCAGSSTGAFAKRQNGRWKCN